MSKSDRMGRVSWEFESKKTVADTLFAKDELPDKDVALATCLDSYVT